MLCVRAAVTGLVPVIKYRYDGVSTKVHDGRKYESSSTDIHAGAKYASQNTNIFPLGK